MSELGTARRTPSMPGTFSRDGGTVIRKGIAAGWRLLGAAVSRALMRWKSAPKQETPQSRPATLPAAVEKPAAPARKPLKVQQTQEEIDAAIEKSKKSTNPCIRLEAKVAQAVRDAGLAVIGVQNKIGPNGSVAEIDVETPEAIIEATTSKKGKLRQIIKLITNKDVNPTGKPVILIAPECIKSAERDIVKAGGYVVQTIEDLIARLRSMKAK